MEHRITFPTMGTLGYAAWDGDIPGAEEALRTRVGQIEADLTRFDPDSQVSRLSGQWSEISPDTARVLVAGESFREATGGAFSVLVGEAVRAWENGEPAGGPEPCPTGAAVEVRKDDGRSYARLRQENQGTARGRTVDCGAIAKGYAADQLRDWLVEHGARRAVVSLGTSSIAAAGREPVPIGILSPWVGLERWGRLLLNGGSLSVSADPATPLGSAPVRSHVIDPHTGAPALTDLCGVLVCGEDGMACEAYSTAFLGLGLDAALALDRIHPELTTLFMTVDGRVFADPRMHVTTEPGVREWRAKLPST